MLLSVGINGALGFGMLLTVLFCLGDAEKAVESPTGYPFIEIFVNGTGSISGGTALVSLTHRSCMTLLDTSADFG